MTWLTWRQHRWQLLAAASVLLVIGAFLLVTGVAMASTFKDSGLAACLTATPSGCSALAASWSSQYTSYQFVIPLFLLLPALIGVFWGGPLISRDVEQGTHRMVWMQSVSRARWLTVKFVSMAVVVIVGSALFTVALEWWSSPLVAASNDSRFNLGIFDLLGMVPVAYSIFAFALGVAAGAVIRKTVPAMGATLVTFAAVRIGVEVFARPHYEPALTDSYSLASNVNVTDASSLPGTWLVSTETLDKAGHVVSNGVSLEFNKVLGDCPFLAGPGGTPVNDPATVQTCIRQAGIHVVASYQPASRYWLFQSIEATIFVVLAAALFAVTFWLVQRRI